MANGSLDFYVVSTFAVAVMMSGFPLIVPGMSAKGKLMPKFGDRLAPPLVNRIP